MIMRFNGHTNSISALELIRFESVYTTKTKYILVSAAKDGLVKFWD